MSHAQLSSIIETAFENRAEVTLSTKGEVRDAVETALNLLDSGQARVAEKIDGNWQVNQWLKKAVLLSFRLNDNVLIEGAPGGANWFDKVPSKFQGWGENQYRAAGFRSVPGAVVRQSAFIGKGVILMPSFVNLGAYVDEGTMVDTWATVGSCAQIGKNVHLSGGVGIGGVLEPLQANPTIIEDNCFVGARSEVVEGVVVGENHQPRHRRSAYRQGASLLRRRFRFAAGQGPARWHARPEPLLRRDRQNRRRADALEDRHQRTAARLTSPFQSLPGLPRQWRRR
jgi:2,3,4,5-tetrahydropyridine-2-carboxylate N-succinyltransferase